MRAREKVVYNCRKQPKTRKWGSTAMFTASYSGHSCAPSFTLSFRAITLPPLIGLDFYCVEYGSVAMIYLYVN